MVLVLGRKLVISLQSPAARQRLAVLTTALVPFGNMETSTPHNSVTSQAITMKWCTFDKVRETKTFAEFGYNPPARGCSTHT